MPEPKRATSSISPLGLVLILSAVFFVVFLVISGAIFLARSPMSPKAASAGASSFFGGNQVGVIEVKGVIMDSRKVLKRLESFADDGEVKAVVLRLSSPGGAVAPSQEIYEAVRRFKKPLVVSMGSIAASGAFYIACGAKKVFANPGTITGSIGVIMEFANLERLYDWAKIQRYAIKTGRFKDVGAEYREMKPEERELLQSMVDDVLAQFKKAVIEGRKLTPAQVSAIADGRILSGTQAKSARLVDELGGLQDAVDEAAREAKISGRPQVVYPERAKRKWIEMLLDDSGSRDESAESSEARFGILDRALDRVLRAVLGLGSVGDPDADSASAGGWLTRPAGLYWIWNGARG